MRSINNRFVEHLDPLLENAGLIILNHDYRSMPAGWGPNEELGRLAKEVSDVPHFFFILVFRCSPILFL